MKIADQLSALARRRRPIVMAAGFFDGLHRGHRQVIGRAVRKARRIGGEAWVLTFDIHPLKLLGPDMAPPLLTSAPHRLQLLAGQGLTGCLILPFDQKIACTEPEDFVTALCRAAPKLRHILVGQDWRFGRKARGDVALLGQLGKEHGFGVTVVQPVRYGKSVISSTRIRASLKRGQLKEAAAMLGRSYSVIGTVIRGRAIGRTLGFPTANLKTYHEVLPSSGVYAVNARIGKKLLPGILNLGVRPTFGGQKNQAPELELHLLDTRRNLYGQAVEVFFEHYIRCEKKFQSTQALQRQIQRDVSRARTWLLKK